MENSVRPTIEKIKLQEQDNEVRLREQRELNAAIASLNRAIHDTSLDIEKLTKEYNSLIVTTDKLEREVIVERTRHSAYAIQVDECRKELAESQKASISGVSSVWEKRSKLLQTVQSTSDKCDIWALLVKPTCDVKPNTIHLESKEPIKFDDAKLKAVINRKNKAIAMRNFLMSEPDVGEEFIRTRNALQYSMEITTNGQNIF